LDQELNIAGNPITTLPSGLGKLSYMEVLDALGCGLINLPEEFPGMVRLLELNLGANKLQELPKEFGRMSRLVTLNLSDNMLVELPMSMGKCVQLQTIQLERNKIEDEELIAKYKIGTDHLVDYMEKRLFAWTQEQKMIKKKAEKKKRKKGGRPKLSEFVDS